MYEHDNRVVMTLDAGGTNFVFSAIKGCELVIAPVCLLSVPDDLDRCLSVLVEGFCRIKDSLSEAPVAISFAFPGPADYEHGVIGDLPNFPAFCGGVALGPFLEEKFGIPVFINNDGNLFAYGEALSGVLPQVNRELEAAGNPKRYKNLLGITLGTGFGAGVVINNCLLTGDNGCGGDVWLMRNKKYPDMLAEESVSIRAIHRVYRELTGEDADAFTPKDIFDIAEGMRAGNREAAIRCFDEMGEMAGAAIVNALNMVDGIVVIGGGLSGASKYILPGMLREMNRSISTFAGLNFKCLQSEVYNLMDDAERSLFLENKSRMVKVPFADKYAVYDCSKKIGIMISSLGASKAIALGAYAYALSRLQ
ncbi:ROK family protein [Bacteroides uniformis]|uniref:ROK family protein n=1 Tax=Bacteroides uniformis TaxID=820 RepID=UPI0039B42749